MWDGWVGGGGTRRIIDFQRNVMLLVFGSCAQQILDSFFRFISCGRLVFALISRPFRAYTHAQELLTPNGKGRLPGDIGKLLNDKLVRLLARLVMRETLKTSTLTSVVITSLALDTDARGRRLQGKHNKSLSPPPIERGHRRHAGAR